MPTYDYECKSCGFRFEKFQGIKEEPVRECPECSREVRRLIGGGLGIIFKGSGFYTTDYKHSSSQTGNAGKKDSNSGSKDNRKNQQEKKNESAKDAKKETTGNEKKEPVKT